MRPVLCAFGLLLLVAWTASALHGTWIDQYTDASGMRCCGQRDCFAVPVRLVSQAPDAITVEVRGVTLTLAPQAVHASEETQTYWCGKSVPVRTESAEEWAAVLTAGNTRCVFVASGG